MAIRIQREVGGNLAVAARHRRRHDGQKRERIRREMQALTAEGRLSRRSSSSLSRRFVARDLLSRPPDYLKTLFDDFVGDRRSDRRRWSSSIIGWFWLRRIVDIEV